MKRMIDSDTIKVNNNGKVEINANVIVNGAITPQSDQSVKKIYCHQIILLRESVAITNIKYTIGILIFTNDNASINTFEKLKTLINSFATTFNFVVTGKVQNIVSGSEKQIVLSHLYHSGTGYNVYGIDENGYYGNVDLSAYEPSTVVDAVYAIN